MKLEAPADEIMKEFDRVAAMLRTAVEQRDRLGQTVINCHLHSGRAIGILFGAEHAADLLEARRLIREAIKELQKDPFQLDSNSNAGASQGSQP